MFKKFYLSILTLLLMALFLLPWNGVKATTPFTEGFESSTLPSTWSTIHVSGSSSYVWKTYMNNYYVAPHNGSYSAFHNYASGGANNYLITPQLTPVTGETLRFYIASQNYTGTTVTIEVAEANSTPTSASAFTTVLATYQSQTNINTSWALKEFDLSAYAGKSIYIAFHAVDANGGNIYVDDVSIVAPVTCPKTGKPEATNIGQNTATISWAEGGSETVWNLRYKSASASDWTVVEGLTTKSHNLTGLTAGKTTYNYEVQADCGGGDASDWNAGTPFQTECGAISVATEDWKDGFEGYTAGFSTTDPGCWHIIGANASSSSYPRIHVTSKSSNSGYVQTGNNSLFIVSSGSDDSYIIFPEFTEPLNTLQIAFSHKGEAGGYPSTVKSSKLTLGYVTDVNDATTFHALRDEFTRSTSWTAEEESLAGILAADVESARLAFKVGASEANNYYTGIDDITISALPSCTKPTVNNATDETFEGATFTWTAGGSETQWQYIVVGSGAAEDWSSPTLTSTNSVTLTGYNAATTYDFYVRSYCSSSEQSESVKKSFTTLAVTAPTAPQVANATTTTADFSWTAAAGVSGYQYVAALSGQDPDWNNAQNTTNNSVQLTNLLPGNTYIAYVRSFYSNNNCYSAVVASDAFDTQCEAKTIDADHTFTETFDALHCWTLTNCVSNTGLNNNVFRFWYGYSNQYLISPELDTEDRQVTIEFDYHKHTSGTETFMVGYSTTTKEVSAFTFGDVITSTNTSDLRYSENLPAGVKYIAIAYTSYDQYYFYIDNFTVTEYVAPACAAPESVSVVENSVTPEGATLSWTSVGEGAEYQYAVKESGDPEDGDWSAATTETSVAISGKTAGTTYTFYVRTKCTTSESAVVTTTFTPVITAPTVPQAANITSSSAVLSWTAADGISKYEVLCLREGAEVEWTGATVVENETSVTVDTLAAQTNYVFYVRSYYVSETLPAGARSAAINKPFQTKCAAFVVSSSASYEENFESGIPACWNATEVVDSWSQGYRWESNNAGKTGKCLRFNNYYVNHILATEPISLTADANLTFYYKNTQGATFQVMISVDGADRVDLGDALGTATDWTKKEIDLTAYTGSTVQLFFYNEYKTSYSSYLWLDELTIEAWPACRKPATINPVTEFTATTATVTWTAGGTETNYQYAVALKDEAPVWDPANVVEALSVELTGLTPITNYDVYVRTYCSVSEQSEAQKVSFQTDCGAVNAPVEIEFSNALPGCWTASDATYTWAPYNRGSGNYCVRFDSYMNGNGNTADLQTAQYKLENNLTLKFSCKNKDGGAFSVDMYVVEDDQTVNLFTDLTGIADWTVKEYNLAAYAGKTVYFTFHGTSNEHDYNSGVDAYLYVDDFRLIRSLTLADDADNSATLASFAGQTFDDVTLGRTIFCDGDYNTICLPFDLATLDGTPLEGATVKAFKYAVIEPEELQVRVIDVEGGLQAGVPYLLKMTADENLVNPLFKNVTISATAAQKIGEDQAVEFVGTFAPVAFEKDNQNTLFVYTENNLTWAGKEGTSLKAFRAYFNRTSGAGAPLRHGMRARIVEHTENATGIENGGWFNGESAIKVLENNQVVIIRNGVKYTVQGQKIQ